MMNVRSPEPSVGGARVSVAGRARVGRVGAAAKLPGPGEVGHSRARIRLVDHAPLVPIEHQPHPKTGVQVAHDVNRVQSTGP